jgi:hypothetical protein
MHEGVAKKIWSPKVAECSCLRETMANINMMIQLVEWEVLFSLMQAVFLKLL